MLKSENGVTEFEGDFETIGKDILATLEGVDMLLNKVFESGIKEFIVVEMVKVFFNVSGMDSKTMTEKFEKLGKEEQELVIGLMELTKKEKESK